MIIADKKAKVLRDGVQQEAHFNIKNENVAHIFSILRNQLYSDKIGAIIREYITNAIDAHVEANVNRPISITVPSVFSNEFIVRDYGKGLSPEDIVEIFASYGASTKRQSNSFTGMLGIGSKSAFAYTNTFTIISRHNGVETLYQAFIDETNVGSIATISSKPTLESGLSIHISIKSDNFNQFQKSIIDFFQYIDYRPEFLGVAIQIPEHKIILQGSNWKFLDTRRTSWRNEKNIYFVMGNVTYQSESTVLENQLQIRLNWLNRLHHCSIVVDVPIGSVKPSASREALEFNETTKDYLRKVLYDLRLDLTKMIREKFEACKTKYDRHCIAYDLNNNFGDLVPQEINRWCFAINADFEVKDDNDSIKIKSITRNFPYLIDTNGVSLQHDTVFVVHHAGQKITHIQPRVTEYFEANPRINQVVVLKFNNPEHMDRIIKHPSLDGAEFVNAETLPYTHLGKTVLKSEEAKVYQFQRNKNLNIESWKATHDTLPSDALYVEISNFKPKHYKENININNAIHTLRGTCGIHVPIIFGVKTADLKKIVQPTWIELKDYITQEFNAWKKNNPDEVRDYEFFKEANAFQKELIGDFKPWKHLRPNLSSYHRRCISFFEVEVALRHFDIDAFKYNPPKEFEELYKRYPYMRAFICSMSYTDKIRLIQYLDMS